MSGPRVFNILLVEDNDEDRLITLKAFQAARSADRIFAIGGGEEALDFLLHQGKFTDRVLFPRPDLILLDIKMPRVDGFEFLHRIKTHPELDTIPVVVLSSSTYPADILRSYKNYACGYIPKRVAFEQFVEIIRGFHDYWHRISRLPPPPEESISS